MKKTLLLLGCFAILGTTAFAAGEFAPERESLNFKVGLTDGEVSPSGELGDYIGDQKTSANISANLEYIASTSSGLEYGAGIGFNKIAINDSAMVNAIIGDTDTYPLYGLVRYKLDNDSELKPYIFANLGYAYADEEFGMDGYFGPSGESIEVEGGLYYAVGVGAEYKDKMSVEFYWSRTELEYKADFVGETIDGDADMLTLAFGYRMDI